MSVNLGSNEIYKTTDVRRWVENFIVWKVHIKMSYLQLMTFLTNGIQALQHRWKKWVNWQGTVSKNKHHLFIYKESILVSLWTFQSTLVKWLEKSGGSKLFLRIVIVISFLKFKEKKRWRLQGTENLKTISFSMVGAMSRFNLCCIVARTTWLQISRRNKRRCVSLTVVWPTSDVISAARDL